MCGRFCLTISEVRRLADRFQAEAQHLPLYRRPRYNIAPTQAVLVVTEEAGVRTLGEMRWGLIPHWARVASIGSRLINARAETLGVKPAFRAALERGRCLIPADGFYEWKARAGGRQPYRIHLPGGGLFAFAGLWDRWTDPDTRTVLRSCAIITCAPNSLMRGIHDRMPVILKPEDEARWLAGAGTEARGLLVPYGGEMAVHPVGCRVNSPRVDESSLLEPVAPDTLF